MAQRPPHALRGAIFDVDGVLVDSPHERAWREALDALMRGSWRDLAASTRWRAGALTAPLYQEHVAGKPREDGARAVLCLFGIDDPDGRLATRYAEAKQALLVQLIERGEFRPFEDGVRMLLALAARGVRTAAASSSRNAQLLLRRIDVAPFAREVGLDAFAGSDATVADVLDADLSGRAVAHGKPAPDIFLAAASELSLGPGSCAVIEDAPAGIEAARAGGMASIGVARLGDEALLREAGADLVVTTLDEVPLEAWFVRDARPARKGGAQAG